MALSIDTSTLMGLQQSALEGEKAHAGSSGAIVGGSKAFGEQKWSVPIWQSGFDLAPALQRAYLGASTHMNGILAPDDLYVDLQPQGDDIIGQVKDIEGGRVVKTYDGLDILRLYTHNVRSRGIVVDGAL
ncbi:MAG: hypothetical protein OXR68_01725 [Alphaproteobacteria bacterium]|nr:hypothetical protein [Alphaproteobacteria bacterium]MDD9919331.1 hypothetical protein [Alphaproteobacteria bacterium]